ncbi:MAG: DUF1266 domain-containing protein [Nocardiopsaceae bacterium]|nr:DUF1266 domain-containing protein [Nocardiopsaceae bacterium]
MADQGSEIAERRRELARAERTLGPRHPTTISAREQLGYAYEDAKRPELALPLLEQVVRDLDRTVGPTHERSVIARKNLANSYYFNLRIADAHALYQQAAGQALMVFGPRHICTMLARSGAATCLLETRRFAEAIAEFDQLLPDWVEGFGPAHRNFLKDRHRLGNAWDGSGSPQGAMTHYWRLLSDCDRHLGATDPLTRRLAADLVPRPRPWWGTEPLGTHRLWLVALSAILAARAHGSALDSLNPSAWLNRHNAVGSLERDWGVGSREDLLSTLDWLAAEGHRGCMAARLGHPPASWDFARYSLMVRNGFAAEYIGEAEAWRLLEGIAGDLAGCYGSWREFADDYLAGRLLWLGGTEKPGGYPASQRQTADAAQSLLDPSNPRSPWNLVPWDAITRPDQPVTTRPAADWTVPGG